MKKNKFRCLILILALCMAKNPLDAFANTGNSNTILEGEIGLWDPYESDKPDFNGIADTDIEGKIPTADKYFNIISVTVPIDMEFMVLPSSTSAFGSFYAPKYTIRNNGRIPVVAKIKSFEMDNSNANADTTPLHIEKVVGGDGRTQMELNICTLDDSNPNNIDKEIDLTRIKSLNENERTLYDIGANDVKQVTFKSTKWEIPKYESKKDNAISSYTAIFEFSAKQP